MSRSRCSRRKNWDSVRPLACVLVTTTRASDSPGLRTVHLLALMRPRRGSPRDSPLEALSPCSCHRPSFDCVSLRQPDLPHLLSPSTPDDRSECPRRTHGWAQISSGSRREHVTATGLPRSRQSPPARPAWLSLSRSAPRTSKARPVQTAADASNHASSVIGLAISGLPRNSQPLRLAPPAARDARDAGGKRWRRQGPI